MAKLLLEKGQQGYFKLSAGIGQAIPRLPAALLGDRHEQRRGIFKNISRHETRFAATMNFCQWNLRA